MHLDYSPEVLQQLQQEEAYRNLIGSIAAQILPACLSEPKFDTNLAIDFSIECAKIFVQKLDEVKP